MRDSSANEKLESSNAANEFESAFEHFHRRALVERLVIGVSTLTHTVYPPDGEKLWKIEFQLKISFENLIWKSEFESTKNFGFKSVCGPIMTLSTQI